MPKSDKVAAEVERDEAGDRVSLDGRAIEVDLTKSVTPIQTLIAGTKTIRLSLVPRKKGGFDVGLRDRVLRVKCEPSG